MIKEAQSNFTLLYFLISSNNCSPQPIAAGIDNSAHLIAICEFVPPYLVISAENFVLNNQSYPGSALSIKTILPSRFWLSGCGLGTWERSGCTRRAA